MKGLIGKLSPSDLDGVVSKTKLRFKNAGDFKTAQALIVYEQRLLDEETLFKLCQDEYVVPLSPLQPEYVPTKICESLRGLDCIPMKFDPANNRVIVGVLPEYTDKVIPSSYDIQKVHIPIYTYVNCYTEIFGSPAFLYNLPVRDKFDFIISEAVTLGAADITIADTYNGAHVYYNCRKRKVQSNRCIDKSDVNGIIQLLMTAAGQMSSLTSRKPTYLSCRLDMHNRGRVVINKTYFGHSVTIRVLSDDLLTQSLEDLNLKENSCTFIRDVVLSTEPGARILIGETYSGKNTTILAALKELVDVGMYKIVSVEQPVEIIIDGVEQIDCETDEEFEMNAASLIRQNPDIVYFTEITSRTAESILKQCNTSKAVFTSVHANSISDVLSRLQDISGETLDRLLLTIQSCIFQKLVRDEKTDTVYPVNRCVHFSDAFKSQLYGKSMAEMKAIIKKEEDKWES